MRVLIVEDDAGIASGLAATLKAAGYAVDVCGALGQASAALQVETFDLVLLDLNLPDGDGVSLGLRLRERWPRTRLLILTMSREPATVLRSLADGVDSYVLKDSPPQELLGAIRATAGGAMVLSPGASASVRVVASTVPDTDPLARLDARDREILTLLVQGLTTSQVAARLFLAPKTIRNRTSEMLGKLGVATKEEAITLGLAGGLGGGGS